MNYGQSPPTFHTAHSRVSEGGDAFDLLLDGGQLSLEVVVAPLERLDRLQVGAQGLVLHLVHLLHHPVRRLLAGATEQLHTAG